MELLKKNINRKIILIDNDGNSYGELSTAQAFQKADEAGLDVVVVNDKNNKMVCKLLDWGKVKFDQQKRDSKQRQNSKRKHKAITIKGNISDHDLERKARDVNKFHDSGYDVTVTLITYRNAVNRTEAMSRIMDMLPISSNTSIESVSSNKRIIKIRGKK